MLSSVIEKSAEDVMIGIVEHVPTGFTFVEQMECVESVDATDPIHYV